MWSVKAVYPQGSHFVFNTNGEQLRFSTESEARAVAEDLTAENRRFVEVKGWNPNPQTSYLAVEDHI